MPRSTVQEMRYQQGLENLKSQRRDEVDLSDCCIEDADINMLAKALASNNTVREFNLSENQISDNGILELLKALASNSSIIRLNIDRNKISDLLIRVVACVIAKNSLPEILNQTGYLLHEPDAEESSMITKILNPSEGEQIDALILKGSYSDSCLELADRELNNCFMKCPSISEIYIEGVQINASKAEILRDVLIQNSRIRRLILIRTGLKSLGLNHLIDALYTNPNLEELILISNRITKKDVCYLIAALACNNRLTHVELDVDLEPEYMDIIQALVERNKFSSSLGARRSVGFHRDEGAAASAGSSEDSPVPGL